MDYDSNKNVEWEDVSKNDYLNSAHSYENQIRVQWAHELYGDTKSRKCLVHSTSQWLTISMNDSFVPRYKGGKLPSDPTAEIFTLSDYLPNSTIEEREKGLQVVNNKSSILQITTAYHTASNSRLIVDGFKRSLGILSRINDNQTFRTVTILECYGESIPEIFYGDFSRVLERV